MAIATALRTLGNALSLNGRFFIPQAILRRCFRHAHGTYRVDDFDGDLSINLRLSEHMERRIFWMGYYSQDVISLLDRLLTANMVVIDVGANIGEISLVAAKRVGSAGRVIAFEPMDEVADELQSSITRNGMDNIHLVRLGLSDQDREDVPIYRSCGQGESDDEHRGLGSLYGGVIELVPSQFITLTTLDSYLARCPLERVDIIKVDIEGAELPCLRGAEQTLRTYRPHLIIEVQTSSSAAAGYAPSDILGFLSGLGYSFAAIGSKGRLSPLHADMLADFQNVLCTPTAHGTSQVPERT